jgi:YVTN family beta-propeller protein
MVAVGLAIDAGAQSSFVNFEGKQTSPIRLSPDGMRLFCVNTPDARLSVFDVSQPSNPVLIAEIPVGLEPVSVNPRSAEEAWVVNEVSDSVSVVSVSRRLVTDTIQVKDEPADVVFARGRAFVSVARNNEIRVFDLTTRAHLATIPVFGENPRALAVSLDGQKVYAAFALSGNHTTIIPAEQAPPQPLPTNITNPPPRAGLIVDARNPDWSSVIGYSMPDHDVVEIDTDSLAVVRYFSELGTINLGLAVQPNTGDLYVANTDARNLVRFEPTLRGHVVDNRVTRIQISNGSTQPFDLNAGIDYSILPNVSAQALALAQPTAIVFDSSGIFMYVAAFGSDRVARLDTNGVVLGQVDLASLTGAAADPRNKRGPRGLALQAGARRLYVLNRISNTLSVIDTGTDTVLAEVPVGSYDPTPAVIRNGRGFLYDARLSGNGTFACASCHVDGDMDLIAWDLGDPSGFMQDVRTSAFLHHMHPMKGPMTTQTLRGLKGSGPFHWRGDRQGFLDFNRNFDALMGSSLLSDTDMLAFQEFILGIVFAPNPNENLDRTLPATIAGGDPNAGAISFRLRRETNNLACFDCHRINPGSGFEAEILPANFLKEPQPFNIPHLRSLYQKLNFNNRAGVASIAGFGFTHDGTEPSLPSFLARHRFQNAPLDETTRNDLSAYLQCFDTGLAPAVGYTHTMSPENVNRPDTLNLWDLLEAQAGVTNIDLIGKGAIDGIQRGFLYQPGQNNYRADKAGVRPFTRAQLADKILQGGILSIMGVPPGSGLRMSLDRDQDGVLDGDTPPPQLRAGRSGKSITLFWPTNAQAFTLEETENVPSAAWRANTEARRIAGDQFNVLVTPTEQHRFYRLRGL